MFLDTTIEVGIYNCGPFAPINLTVRQFREKFATHLLTFISAFSGNQYTFTWEDDPVSSFFENLFPSFDMVKARRYSGLFFNPMVEGTISEELILLHLTYSQQPSEPRDDYSYLHYFGSVEKTYIRWVPQDAYETDKDGNLTIQGRYFFSRSSSSWPYALQALIRNNTSSLPAKLRLEGSVNMLLRKGDANPLTALLQSGQPYKGHARQIVDVLGRMSQYISELPL